MISLFSLVYVLLSLYWAAVCIDRGRFKPKTRGDLIMTILLLPTVLFTKISFVVIDCLLRAIFALLNKGSILKNRTKLAEYWKKEL